MLIPDDENDKNYTEQEQLMRKIFRLIKLEMPDAAMVDVWIIICLIKLKLEMQMSYFEKLQLDEIEAKKHDSSSKEPIRKEV